MERLWSPWRMEYIESAKGEQADGCIFCDLASSGDDARALVLTRGALAFAVLNRFPYNPGHLMVAPYRHTGDLDALEPDEAAEVHALLRRSVRALRDEMEPDGYNIGMNLGRVAGAGVPGHLHWHVVPRWSGDANFMTVTGEARVLPEALDTTWRKLAPRFAAA